MRSIDALRKRDLLETVIHELLHLSSYQSFNQSGPDTVLEKRRTGYDSVSFRNEANLFRENFHLLNEAVTQFLTLETMKDNREEIEKSLGYTPIGYQLKLQEQKGAYAKGIKLLKIIMRGMAEHQGVDKKTIWLKFKQGYFTGKLIFLKDIEKTFGKKSLSQLAGLEASLDDDKEDESNKKLDEAIEFFSDTGPHYRRLVPKKLSGHGLVEVE